MNSRQTSHTRQSHYTPPPPTMPRAVFDLTLGELVQLFGDLNRLFAALQKAAGTPQNDLPTIRIDD